MPTLCRRFPLPAIFFVLLAVFHAPERAEAWDFSGKQLSASLTEVARKNRLTIIATVPDTAIASLSVPDTASPEAILRDLAKSVGAAAPKFGNTFFIIPAKEYRDRENLTWIFVHSRERPIEAVLKSLPEFPPPEVKVFPFPQANFCVLAGLRDDLRNARESLHRSEKPGSPLRVAFHLSERQSSGIIASLTFPAIDEVPTGISFSVFPAPNREMIGTLTVSASAPGEWEMKGSLISDLSSGTPTVFSSITGMGRNPGRFEIRLGATEYVGSWSVFVLPDTLRLAAPAAASTGAPVEESREPAPDEESEPPEKYLELAWVDRPITEILTAVVASAGENLIVPPDCFGTLTLLYFGQELYFEEFMSLIARAKNFSLRKIGNTWVFNPPEVVVDGCCGSLFATRRLQFIQAGTIGTPIRNLLDHFRLARTIPFSDDPFLDLLIWGGPVFPFENLRKFVDQIDTPPHLLEINSLIRGRGGETGEIFQAATGRPFTRIIRTVQVTDSLDFLPVLFSPYGWFGIRYSVTRTTPTGRLRIEGWSYLPSATGPAFLEIGGADPLELLLLGKGLPPLIPEPPPMNQEPSWEAPIGSSTPADPDGFDKPFDLSF